MTANRTIGSVLIFAALQLYADAGGVWEGQLTMRGRAEMHRDVTLSMNVIGSRLSGTMSANGETAEILDGTEMGDDVFFAITSGADDIPRFEFHGRVTKNVLKLVVTGQVRETGATLTIGVAELQRSR